MISYPSSCLLLNRQSVLSSSSSSRALSASLDGAGPSLSEDEDASSPFEDGSDEYKEG